MLCAFLPRNIIDRQRSQFAAGLISDLSDVHLAFQIFKQIGFLHLLILKKTVCPLDVRVAGFIRLLEHRHTGRAESAEKIAAHPFTAVGSFGLFPAGRVHIYPHTFVHSLILQRKIVIIFIVSIIIF